MTPAQAAGNPGSFAEKHDPDVAALIRATRCASPRRFIPEGRALCKRVAQAGKIPRMISDHDGQVLVGLPVWNPAGDIVAQRRAWEELAKVYNRDLPDQRSSEKRRAARGSAR